MHDNLDVKKIEREKKGDNKRKKEKWDNFNDNEKEQLRKYEKKGNQVMRDSLDVEKEKRTF